MGMLLCLSVSMLPKTDAYALYLSIRKEHVAVLHRGESLAEDEGDHLLPDDRARHARQLRVNVVFQNLHKSTGIHGLVHINE
jgi:hypothetical protein